MVTIDKCHRPAGIIPPARRLPSLLRLIVWLIVAGFGLPAEAHDPGLSFAEIEIHSQTILLKMTFARRDIEPLVTLDGNHDDQVSTLEFGQAKRPLTQLAGGLAELVIDGRSTLGALDEIVFDVSDALIFRFEFARGAEQRFHFKAPIIERMTLGHRQFVSVIHQGTTIHSQILSAAAAEATVRLQSSAGWRQIVHFVSEGIWHIWIGFDHILFLVALLLPAAVVFVNGTWRAKFGFKSTLLEVVKIVTAFTAAHSITLTLAVLGWIHLNSVVVESVIAASVIFAAVNNVRPFVRERVWLMSFGFGLIHGLGFASALSGLGVTDTAKVYALIGFNLGVEIGQLVLIAVLLPMIYLGSHRPVYRRRLLPSASIVIALIASLWLVERVSGREVLSTLLAIE